MPPTGRRPGSTTTSTMPVASGPRSAKPPRSWSPPIRRLASPTTTWSSSSAGLLLRRLRQRDDVAVRVLEPRHLTPVGSGPDAVLVGGVALVGLERDAAVLELGLCR